MQVDKISSWTDSRYWGFIRSALRRAFLRYPNKYAVMKQARTKTPKGVMYKCATCNCKYKQKEVTVDHIQPCGTLLSYEDLPRFVERLYCGIASLQVLCKDCHRYKTLAERGMTETDMQVAAFKRLNAKGQVDLLNHLPLKHAVGSNIKNRVLQYKEHIEHSGKVQSK